MTARLLTGIGRLFSPTAARTVDHVEDAVVALDGTRIEWVGSRTDLPRELRDRETIDCEGRAVVPGFVDAHTHLVFAGDRATEFSRRLGGETYESIAAAGGGIRATVDATRAASRDELVAASSARLDRMIGAGTTTVEIKTGYGLDLATESKMVDVIEALAAATPVDVVTTVLAAHATPEGTSRDSYLELVMGEVIPMLAGRAAFCDVFCDPVGFSADECRMVLDTASAHGLGLRVHADQTGRAGGAEMAAAMGAASADHLDHATAADLEALRRAGTVAVLLPGASLTMRLPFPGGRAVWDSGVELALATDCNPGTSYLETMPFVVALGVLEMGLSPSEALWAATLGGARALQLADRGVIAPGMRADLVVLDTDHHVDLSYRPDGDHIWQVVAGGRPLRG
ncbi:MAG: imidazolonepropionase [Acidimicrobiia bacterium]|nr:imidazolonepropionase [Acidimicrobiia bacterium]